MEGISRSTRLKLAAVVAVDSVEVAVKVAVDMVAVVMVAMEETEGDMVVAVTADMVAVAVDMAVVTPGVVIQMAAGEIKV